MAAEGLRSAINYVAGDRSANFSHIVLCLTLGLLAFYGFGHFYFQIPFQILLIIVLLFPHVAKNSYLWLCLSLFSICAVSLTWDTADNHKYLLCYWVAYIYLVVEFVDEADWNKLLEKGARWLMFFTMAGAVVQKCLSPDYLSGEFFQFVFLTDGRFSHFTALITGEDLDLIKGNIDTYREAVNYQLPSTTTAIALYLPDSVKLLAGWVTWINFLDQLLIAILVLLPLPDKLSVAKHYVLYLFIGFVYLIAPVLGFGWMICIWGYCLVPQHLFRLRLGYLALIFLLTLYEFPWLKALS